MHPKTARRSATAFGLGVLLLSGCGGDDAAPAQQTVACAATDGTAGTTADPRLVVAGSEDVFMSVARDYLTEMGTAGCAAQRSNTGTDVAGPATGGAAAPSVPSGGASTDSSANSPGTTAGESRSGTNVQESGVDEADLVETDGRYFYIAESSSGFDIGVGASPGIAMPVAAVTDPRLTVPSAGSNNGGATGGGGPVPDSKPIDAYVPPPPSVRIMALDNTTPSAQTVTKLALPAAASHILGIYLRSATADGLGTQLIVVANGAVSTTPEPVYGTLLYAYDVTDPTTPVLSWTLAVGGSHLATRVTGGKLYLVEANYPDYGRIVPLASDPVVVANNTENIRATNPADLLPPIYLNGEAKNFVQASDCLVPVAANPDLYLFPTLVTVLAIDVADPNNSRGLCTLESSGRIYASSAALYLTRGLGAETIVHKIHFTANGLEYGASGVVPGDLGGSQAQFALSEHGNDLRVVTTQYHYGVVIRPVVGGGASGPASAVAMPDAPVKSDVGVAEIPTLARAIDGPEHRLFVLREDSAAKLLNKIAELPNASRPAPLGKPGELLHGVRFAGDRAYLVTFKKTDPFYVVDLSNPADPFVAGELTLPGYSDYLQPLGNGLVLGVGKDAVDEGDFAWYQGVKVGVFDVTNPTAPKVLGEKLIGKRGSDTPALYDHHAVTVLSDAAAATHRIAVPVQVNETPPPYGEIGAGAWYDWSYTGLFLFDVTDASSTQGATFSENGVIVNARATPSSGLQPGGSSPRSILVGDAVHYSAGNGVWSAKWQSPATAVGPQ